ncbi:hypothetical protein [Natronorarus salvus]|uniref:hypothetical protein n=1 Tax=Natronorarus salvus TaxID=3117733 RepID=UPI002F266134
MPEKISIRHNANGRLVGIDDQGNEVPLDVDELDALSVSTEAAEIGEGVEPEDELTVGLTGTDTEFGFGADGTFSAAGFEPTDPAEQVGHTSIILDGDQTVSQYDWERVEFNDVEEDDFGAWDSTEYEYVVPADGVYHVVFEIGWTGGDGGAGDIAFRLNRNGSVTRGRCFNVWNIDYPSGGDVSQKGNTRIRCQEGDILDLQVRHRTVGQPDLHGGSVRTFLTVDKVM